MARSSRSRCVSYNSVGVVICAPLRLAGPILYRTLGWYSIPARDRNQVWEVKVARTPARDMFDRDTASKALGIELLDAGNGRATVRMTGEGEVVAEFRGRGRVIGE